MTDPLGGVTQYQYDATGNLTQQTDVLGHATSYTYDANGNRLTETKAQTTTGGTRTVLTQYQYDGANRLTQTTFADGGTTKTIYNGIGKQAITTDQLGRQTNYEYDLMARLTKTTFPDSTTESAIYDAEGNHLSSTDRAGHTTSSAYDGFKRLTLTTLRMGPRRYGLRRRRGSDRVASTRNVAPMRLRRGGRRASVTDDSTTSRRSFTRCRNQVSMTDAGNVTQYQHDNNRRLKTIYPDLTSDSSHDAMGRILSKTDQVGKTTQFQHDKPGRLTAVIDALPQTTV